MLFDMCLPTLKFCLISLVSVPYYAFGISIRPIVETSGIQSNATANNVIETQYATCKISTQDLVVNAHATFTKVLTEACNAKTMDERLQNLEINLVKELGEIKRMLNDYLLIRRRYSEDLVRQKKPIERKDLKEKEEKDNDDENFPNLYSLGGIEEVVKFNRTSSKTFTYYWSLRNFDKKLTNWNVMCSERSSTFYIYENGYAMYLKMIPKYFSDDAIFVSVGLTRGRYDSNLNWPFSHKIHLEILDRHSSKLKALHHERLSRIWDPSDICTEDYWARPRLIGEADNPACVGLSISKNIIFFKGSSHLKDTGPGDFLYLWSGSLLVKLTVYL